MRSGANSNSCPANVGMSSRVACPPPSTRLLSLTSHPPLTRMGLSQSFRLFLTLLALATPFAVASAQDVSVLDPPMEMISDGYPVGDNVLLFPLNAQQARNRIDGLLVLSKLWSRQQEVTCASNYTTCEGSGYCCPEGNACCSGKFLGQRICGRDVGSDSYNFFY